LSLGERRDISPSAVLFRAFENEQGRVFLVAPGVPDKHAFIRFERDAGDRAARLGLKRGCTATRPAPGP
jgi:hypothetical protein